MMTALSKRLRWRAALTLAAIYAFCILAPSAALAYSQVAAHCLTEAPGAAHVHGASTTTHTHADGTAHEHGAKAGHQHSESGASHEHGKSGDKSHSKNCCGLFCISAIAHEPPSTLAIGYTPVQSFPALSDALVGRGPERITRPPIG